MTKSTPAKPPAPDIQPPTDGDRTERLRPGFYIVVAQTAVTAISPLRTAALALLCPLGPDRNALVSLSILHTEPCPIPSGGAVLIVIDTALLKRILNADYELLPAHIAEIGSEALALARTAELTLAAHAIRGCRHQGAIRNLFLKSKALEMLALAFGALRVGRHPAETLSQRDQRAVLRVRDLLLQRLETPPRLDELAAISGMCETRLKTAFKTFFGQTPANFSRSARMTAARDMLVGGRCRVSEAAMAVGYSNISHFTDAFVKEYGVRPGRLARLVCAEKTGDTENEKPQGTSVRAGSAPP